MNKTSAGKMTANGSSDSWLLADHYSLIAIYHKQSTAPTNKYVYVAGSWVGSHQVIRHSCIITIKQACTQLSCIRTSRQNDATAWWVRATRWWHCINSVSLSHGDDAIWCIASPAVYVCDAGVHTWSYSHQSWIGGGKCIIFKKCWTS